MKVLSQPFITRQKTADKFDLKQMTHPVIFIKQFSSLYQILAAFVKHLLTSLQQTLHWSIVHSTIGLQSFFRKRFLDHLVPKFTKTTILKEIQTLIVK